MPPSSVSRRGKGHLNGSITEKLATPRVASEVLAPEQLATQLSVLASSAFAVSLYARTNRTSTFIYDDEAAFLNNIDVSTAVPWRDHFRHDFWGHDVLDADSHKSYRPLCTVAFRLM